ncbi:hypothetical protein Taro_047065 [Colocasia esculenta]|uniref:Uncharacterized protein n=1 Tax=Colocasia esculenta TaxID=4460 RepID=A0A843X6A1_COLES|nr:hypothetical protein [Colocasia esculenta]
MSKPQLFFPTYNRTPKHHGCLNTLHQTLGDVLTSCWGRVGEFLAAGEQEIVHTKPFFFPFSSAATCTNYPLEVDQSLGGYGTEYLSPEQQERFTFVKTKLCGNKTVDVTDLEKNGMHSIVAAVRRMQWTIILTFSEVSYPDLVKAFYVCLKSEADGSLTSSVKGTTIKIDYNLLKTLFDVNSTGHSGIHTVDTQTSVAEGEAIIGEAPEVQPEEVVAATSVTPIAPESTSSQGAIFETEFSAELAIGAPGEVASAAEEALESSVAVELERESAEEVSVAPAGAVVEEAVASSHLEDAAVEDAPSHEEQNVSEPQISESVAVGHNVEVSVDEAPIQKEQTTVPDDTVMEEAPIQGEQEGEQSVSPNIPEETSVPMTDTSGLGTSLEGNEGIPQGESIENPPEEHFRDGETASSSESDEDANIDEVQDPVNQSKKKRKDVAPELPLLADAPYQRTQRQKIVIQLKHVIERLDVQGEILCSLQSDVNSIFMIQASTSKEMLQVRNAMKWFNKEMGSMKALLSEVLQAIKAQAPPSSEPPSTSAAEMEGPSVVSEEVPLESGPSGPSIQEQGQSGSPVEGSGPSEQAGKKQIPAEEPVVDPVPPISSPSQTPAPPSPPSASTAPPAPPTFKQPQPRNISSPTPFSSHSTSPPASSTPFPPPPPIFEVPPTSSSAGASSSGPSSSAGPSHHTSSNPPSLLHPHNPPSFITIIPEGAQIDGPYLSPIKDEFEDTILGSVLKVGEHIHVSNPSCPPSKKRKTSSSSFNPVYPPLWFSLTEVTKNKPLYRDYLTKVVFATLFNLPFLNLSDHLHIILPYTSLTKFVRNKIFSSAQSFSEEEWARSNKVLYNKFLSARSEVFPPRDHSLTLSEWFLLHHSNIWAPFIQKEIKLIRQFKMFNDYRYLHRLLEVQFSQFRQAIRNLGSEHGTAAIQVDFATLQLPEATYLPPLHSLLMGTPVGSIIFEHFARVMGRIKVQEGSVVAFPRFIFREYHLGHIRAEILAPALSECERLTPAGWAKFYPLSAQQLSDTNATLAREGRPPI